MCGHTAQGSIYSHSSLTATQHSPLTENPTVPEPKGSCLTNHIAGESFDRNLEML